MISMRLKNYLPNFMSEIGEGASSMDSVSALIQMISCAGMMHGSTLGFTRLTIIRDSLVKDR